MFTSAAAGVTSRGSVRGRGLALRRAAAGAARRGRAAARRARRGGVEAVMPWAQQAQAARLTAGLSPRWRRRAARVARRVVVVAATGGAATISSLWVVR